MIASWICQFVLAGGGVGGVETEAAANGDGGGGSVALEEGVAGEEPSVGSMRLRLNSRSMLETAGQDSLVKN